MRALFSALVLLGGGSFAAGLRAYEQGRFKEALESFARAERDAGGSASPELLHDLALAALRAGDLALAESSAQKAAARGGAAFVPLRDFVLGNVAFARCETAAVQASQVEAEPFAYDLAIAQAEKAARSWELAAASRSDWPEARRNVERALLALEDLRRKQEEALKKKQSEAPPEEQRAPEPPPPDDREPEPVEAPEAQSSELSAEQVKRLLETLAAKEREKLAVRREQRAAQASLVEKDW